MPVLNRLPIGGASGGSSGGGKINLFTQLTEPATKDGIWIKTNVPYKSVKTMTNVGAHEAVNSIISGVLPYKFYNGSAVIFNGEIHILGGTEGKTNHFSWNGMGWTQHDDLPFDFCNGSAVVFKGKIYILGGSEEPTKCYYWDGRKWTQSTDIPYKFKNGDAVVYDDKIHIFGGNGVESGNTNTIFNHYTWGGKAWTKLSALPHSFVSGAVAVYKGKVHILGGTGTGKSHTTWNGSDYNDLAGLPISFSDGCAVAGDRYIHIIGGTDSYDKRYHYDGKEWTKCEDIPYSFINGSSVVLNGVIHILGGSTTNTELNHRTYDGVNTWLIAGRPASTSFGKLIVYKGKLYNMDWYDRSSNKWYVWTGTSWKQMPVVTPATAPREVLVCDNKLYFLGSDQTSSQDRYRVFVRYWDGSSWNIVDDIPYWDIRIYCVYNNKIYAFNGNQHWVLNGTSWTELDNLPESVAYYGVACEFNGEIHLITANGSTRWHYSWNGTTWAKHDTAPSDIPSYGTALVFNDKLYVIGGGSNYNAICAWDGKSWTDCTSVPFASDHPVSAAVYDIDGESALIFSGYKRLDRYVLAIQTPAYKTQVQTGRNTVAIRRNNRSAVGNYSVVLADVSPVFSGGDGRCQFFFDDVRYSGDQDTLDVDDRYEYYYGNGSKWIKINH